MPSLGELATLVDGDVVGDAARIISDIAPLHEAGPQHLSFLANPKYKPALRSTQAGGVLVRRDWSEECESSRNGTSLILCKDPYLAMAQLLTVLRPQIRPAQGRDATACVAANAHVEASVIVEAGVVIGENAHVGARSWLRAGCVVGRGARLGTDCLLHSGALVLDGCVLGDRVILQAGAVIGSDGFGYAPDASGVRHKIPQVGIVVLEDDVEIGANSTIDRATFGETRIGQGTKIDNLVQIAHNVITGEHCVIVSQTGIAGSTTLGDRVILGAQSGAVGHIRITNDVVVGARGGLANDIDTPGIYSGAPAMPHAEWRRMIVVQSQLPELRRQMRELSARIQALETTAKE